MKKILLIAIISTASFACSKDKVETKPHLRIKSHNTDFVELNSSLRTVFEFSDKEGDLDSIYYQLQRLNVNGPKTSRAIGTNVPNFPKEDNGEIEFVLSNGQGFLLLTTDLNPPIPISGSTNKKENDTLKIKFFLKDREKNVSDTVTLNNIVVQRSL